MGRNIRMKRYGLSPSAFLGDSELSGIRMTRLIRKEPAAQGLTSRTPSNIFNGLGNLQHKLVYTTHYLDEAILEYL